METDSHLTDGASVSSSLTHSTDLSCSSTSNHYPSINCSLVNGFHVDKLYACQANPKLLKKLNFVVCSERSLEIHESEKSYGKKKRAKIIIDLSTIYGITKRQNEKLNLCLMLVTSEQTFYLRALTETGTHEWHALLISNIHTSRSLVQGRQISYNDFPDNTWDVNVTIRPKLYRKVVGTQMENLCLKERRACGRKRLCFFPHAVILLQLHTEPGDLASNVDRDPESQDPNNYFYFARPFISFYGCQRKYFFIKTSTAAFGTCEVVMECDSTSTAIEVYDKFKNTAIKNVNVHDIPWNNFMDEATEEDEFEDDYYHSDNIRTNSSSSDENNIPVLAPATSYYTERKPIKEVRFKTEEQPELHPVEKIPKDPSIDDGIVGQAIAVDILRLGRAKPPGKKQEFSNAFNGLIASIKKKFHDKSPPTNSPTGEKEEDAELLTKETRGFREQVAELKQWAENRASLIEDETEDSGGTLKVIEDPLNSDSQAFSAEDQRKLRRDALFSNAVKQYPRYPHSKNAEKSVEIEMNELPSSRLTDNSTECTSTDMSSCGNSIADSDFEHRYQHQHNIRETKLDSNSSTSALDSCLSNTSEDFSAASSISNVEYTWKPISSFNKTKRNSLDTHSCAGRYTTVQTQIHDDVSDMSNDSCYSSLTNNGYHQLPKSQSLTQLICDISNEAAKKSPTSESAKLRQFDMKRMEKCEPIEEYERGSLKPIKSSNDLASEVQQQAFRAQIVKMDDPTNVATIRQRATSLGNKTWAVTPLSQSLQKKRHREECKKRKCNSSTTTSQTEEQPLLGDDRHSSISSQSECSHRESAANARARLAQALLRNNPRRSNIEDLAEVNFVRRNSPSGGSLGSMNTSINEMHPRTDSDPQREMVQAFGGTNRALIPTTRYSEGSNSSSRGKASKARRNYRKDFDLEVVQCYINPNAFEHTVKPQSAPSTSSRESCEDTPRCRNSRRQTDFTGPQEPNRHSCRRKHRTSCQDVITEEEYASFENNHSTRKIANKIMENERFDDNIHSSTTNTNSDVSSQKSEDQAVGELKTLDMLNNNPNAVTIFA